MKKIPVRHIKKRVKDDCAIPIHMALVDDSDISSAGVTREIVLDRIAGEINAPVGINIFDMHAVTTTSDGIVVEGAIVKMAAGDVGKIHKEFGMLPMAEINIDASLLDQEPHLRQIEQLYPGRRLFRGPNPASKHVPVHNAVMTGRAVNNNSATEMMDVVTMDEILVPILGQLQLMRDGDVLFGQTGEHISVGIGMTVAEKFGRVFPFRQFRAGDTAHGSGEFAKNLKDHIPCILAPKDVLARYIIQALRIGMVPGRELGCSPAVLAVAKVLQSPIDIENITPRARRELESIGLDDAFFGNGSEKMTDSEVIENADQVIPGAENTNRYPASEFMEIIHINV